MFTPTLFTWLPRILIAFILTVSTVPPSLADAPIVAGDWGVARSLKAAVFPPAPGKGDGLVIAFIRIGVDGAVVKASREHGDGALGKLIVASLRDWRYEPFTYAGRRTEVDTWVSVAFIRSENRYYTQFGDGVCYGPPGATIDTRALQAKGDKDSESGYVDVEYEPDQQKVQDRLSTLDILVSTATKRPQPEYPRAALAEGASGKVIVLLLVSTTGIVLFARPLEGPEPLFGASVRAARHWEFTPTLISLKPVRVVGTVSFTFKMGRR